MLLGLGMGVKGGNKKVKSIDLTLSVLAVLVGRHVVDSVARGAVGRGAVGLRAGQGGQGRHGGDAGETLQALDVIHALAAAGGHARRGLQAARERGDGVVALGLMWHAAWIQQTHHLIARTEQGNKAEKGENHISLGRYFVFCATGSNLSRTNGVVAAAAAVNLPFVYSCRKHNCNYEIQAEFLSCSVKFLK